MNLYNSSNPAKAELVLAEAWRKSAYAEGHRRRLPEPPPPGGKGSGRKRCGATAALRDLVKTLQEPVTIRDFRKLMSEYEHFQVGSAVGNALEAGDIIIVGKNVHGLNLYRAVQA